MKLSFLEERVYKTAGGCIELLKEEVTNYPQRNSKLDIYKNKWLELDKKNFLNEIKDKVLAVIPEYQAISLSTGEHVTPFEFILLLNELDRLIAEVQETGTFQDNYRAWWNIEHDNRGNAPQPIFNALNSVRQLCKNPELQFSGLWAIYWKDAISKEFYFKNPVKGIVNGFPI